MDAPRPRAREDDFANAGTKPVTLAGAAALVNYARHDISGSLGDVAAWSMAALKTVAELAREIARLVKLQLAPTNPKLIALATKLDEAQAHLRVVKAREDPDEKEKDKAYDRVFKLEDKLAEAVATNLDEMKLKARWADIASGDYAVASSIVRDLRALSPKPEGGAYSPCEDTEPF